MPETKPTAREIEIRAEKRHASWRQKVADLHEAESRDPYGDSIRVARCASHESIARHGLIDLLIAHQMEGSRFDPRLEVTAA